MGPPATQRGVAADLRDIIDSVKTLRGGNMITDSVSAALEGAEICLTAALARAVTGEVVNQAEQ
jgi:hypothetical protein